MKPFTISSDQHAHNWSAFSTTLPSGVNSRLQAILDELRQQADHTIYIGGDTMFLAGDLFHVRGKIDPEVLNPTIECFKEITAKGIKVYAIAGNHDLKGNRAEAIGNAMQSLNEIEGFTAVTEPVLVDSVFMVPWIEDLDELRAVCKANASEHCDLIIHAPINGVLRGIPDLGLEPEEIAEWGYARVFSGHYHNHKEFAEGLVYSVGATTHQTWSDPGTKAGFLAVGEVDVEHHPSRAPSFVNVDDIADITKEAIAGNYVRLRLKEVEDAELWAAKEALNKAGALSWVDHSSRKRTITRIAARAPSGNLTIEASVASFVMKNLDTGNLDKRRIAKEALATLSEAQTMGNS